MWIGPKLEFEAHELTYDQKLHKYMYLERIPRKSEYMFLLINITFLAINHRPNAIFMGNGYILPGGVKLTTRSYLLP